MWRTALDQLFRRIVPDENSSLNATIFGIVAIGKYLKVYEYQPASGEICDFSMPGYTARDAPLHTLEDAGMIQQILDYIREYQLTDRAYPISF